MRAGTSGILDLEVELGDRVVVHQVLGTVFDSFGRRVGAMRAASDGVVIGRTLYPLVNRGDAVVHVADLSA